MIEDSGLAIWQADCSFAVDTDEGLTTERTTTIHYLAPATDVGAAVAAAVAWVENRQRIVPEWFGNLLALKVYAFTPSAIGPTGQLTSPTGFYHYAWKCDSGRALPRSPV